MRVVVLFGGPGVEHNISASTLKPWVTALHGAELEPEVYFLRAAEPVRWLEQQGLYEYPQVECWSLQERFLFANTCEDFSSRDQLREAGNQEVDGELPDLRQPQEATVVSLVHGLYGEDGVLAEKLSHGRSAEEYAGRVLLPVAGALRRSFDKVEALGDLDAAGLCAGYPVRPVAVTIPTAVFADRQQGSGGIFTPTPVDPSDGEAVERLRASAPLRQLADAVCEAAHKVLGGRDGRVVLKPARGGSSFGVGIVDTARAASDRTSLLLALDRILAVTDNLPFRRPAGEAPPTAGDAGPGDLSVSRVVVEPYMDPRAQHEFSVITLGRGLAGEPRAPVALCPTGITPPAGSIFDTRQKGLYGAGARLDTPPRMVGAAAVAAIREQAALAHGKFDLDVMARVDGFVCEASTGPVVTIAEVNAVAGMTSASFTFIQAAHVGLNHGDFVRYLLRAKGAEIPAPKAERRPKTVGPVPVGSVNVVLGGATSERDVSRQSGFFAGLCLAEAGFDTSYSLLDRSGSFTPIGLFYALHHQVDQIDGLVDDHAHQELARELSREIMRNLGADDDGRDLSERYLRVGLDGKQRLTLEELLEELRADAPGTPGAAVPVFVFLALHGGVGEDGTLQAALEVLGAPYNGSGPKASATCIDKQKASRLVDAAGIDGVVSVPTEPVSRMQLYEMSHDGARRFFADWTTRWRGLGLDPAGLVLKPNGEGSSTGVFICSDEAEFDDRLLDVLSLSTGDADVAVAARSTAHPDDRWVVQPALADARPPANAARDRDSLRTWFRDRRYVEITVGVLESRRHPDAPEPRRSPLRPLEPSVSVKKGEFLTLEEKFQQGGGENIPLRSFEVPDGTVESVIRRSRDVALALGIEGYARLDFIYDLRADRLYFLEANTLCALTDATVFFTQAYDPRQLGLSPPQVLEAIVEAGVVRFLRFRKGSWAG